MKYKALALDVDGTLVVHGEPCARPAVVEAVKRAQQAGIKVIISTGRTFFAMSQSILGGIKPDFAVCANGAQTLTGSGKLLSSQAFTQEEMYALVDFFEDFDYSLAFCFSDNYYVYVEYEQMRKFYHTATGHDEYVLDGEDQVRHLEDMPFGAFAILPEESLKDFDERYGYLGLQFMGYRPGYYDVMQKGMNKSKGLERLMEMNGWTKDELIAIGDGDNDAAMLELAGLSFCMENGSEKAKAAANHRTLSVKEEGVAAAIEKVLNGEL